MNQQKKNLEDRVVELEAAIETLQQELREINVLLLRDPGMVLLTPEEIAKHLRVSVYTVRKLIEKQRLKAKYIVTEQGQRGAYRVQLQEFRRYLEADDLPMLLESRDSTRQRRKKPGAKKPANGL